MDLIYLTVMPYRIHSSQQVMKKKDTLTGGILEYNLKTDMFLGVETVEMRLYADDMEEFVDGCY